MSLHLPVRDFEECQTSHYVMLFNAMKSQWVIPKQTQEIKQILHLPLSWFQLRSKNKNINESKDENKNRSIFSTRVFIGIKVFLISWSEMKTNDVTQRLPLRDYIYFVNDKWGKRITMWTGPQLLCFLRNMIA